MDQERHEELRLYLRDLADLMGLRDWTVTLSSDRPDNQSHAADIVCLYGRKFLTVRLSPGFAGFSLEEQRHWLTHELAHAHLWALDFTLNNVESHLSAAVFDLLQKCIGDNIEFAVDALAEIIAPHMPLPLRLATAKTQAMIPEDV